MTILMIVLRLVHVIGGVFWAGATFVLASHVTPSVNATGQGGQQFMQHLSGKSNISGALSLTGSLTVVSGLIMYSLNGWDQLITTAPGLVLLLGVVVGLGAYLHGMFVQRKTVLSMQALGAEVAQAGGPPTPEQSVKLGELAGKLERNGQLLAYLLAFTVIAMGIFQYV